MREPQNIWEAFLALRSDQHLLAGSEYELISTAVKWYTPKGLHIRPFSLGNGRLSLSEEIYDGQLEVKKHPNSLELCLNNNTRIYLETSKQAMKIAYQRYVDGEHLFLPPHVAPTIKNLPQAQFSILRHVFDNYLVQIGFEEHIHLKEARRDGEMVFYSISTRH